MNTKHYILIDWVWGNSKFVVPEKLTIDRGEADVNSQGRGGNKLAIPEYTVYKYFIIPKNIRLIVEWSPQNDKDQYNHASFASILHYRSEYCLMANFMLFPQSFISDSFEKVDFNINLHGDYKSYEHFDFFWNYEILKFCENFRVFVNRRWSPRVPNKHKTFIRSGRGTKNPRKRFTLPVHSLKNYGPLNSQTTGKEKK